MQQYAEGGDGAAEAPAQQNAAPAAAPAARQPPPPLAPQFDLLSLHDPEPVQAPLAAAAAPPAAVPQPAWDPFGAVPAPAAQPAVAAPAVPAWDAFPGTTLAAPPPATAPAAAPATAASFDPFGLVAPPAAPLHTNGSMHSHTSSGGAAADPFALPSAAPPSGQAPAGRPAAPASSLATAGSGGAMGCGASQKVQQRSVTDILAMYNQPQPQPGVQGMQAPPQQHPQLPHVRSASYGGLGAPPAPAPPVAYHAVPMHAAASAPQLLQTSQAPLGDHHPERLAAAGATSQDLFADFGSFQGHQPQQVSMRAAGGSGGSTQPSSAAPPHMVPVFAQGPPPVTVTHPHQPFADFATWK